jgi:hypothetical protein
MLELILKMEAMGRIYIQDSGLRIWTTEHYNIHLGCINGSGIAAGWGTMLQAGISDEVIGFFYLLIVQAAASVV